MEMYVVALFYIYTSKYILFYIYKYTYIYFLPFCCCRCCKYFYYCAVWYRFQLLPPFLRCFFVLLFLLFRGGVYRTAAPVRRAGLCADGSDKKDGSKKEGGTAAPSVAASLDSEEAEAPSPPKARKGSM